MMEMPGSLTARDRFWFGVIWLIALSLIGLNLSLRHEWWLAGSIAWGLAVIVPIAGMIHAPVLDLVHRVMSWIAFPIGWVVSHVILALIYYLVITPIGCVLRVLGYDPMKCRWDVDASSYWVEARGEPKADDYFKQF